jgi:hypothetical protein
VFTFEEQATILRRHRADTVPVSDLCDECQLTPSLFCLWQKQAGEVAVSPSAVYRVLKAAGCLDRWTRIHTQRLHSAIRSITPADRLAGRAEPGQYWCGSGVRE